MRMIYSHEFTIVGFINIKYSYSYYYSLLFIICYNFVFKRVQHCSRVDSYYYYIMT